MISAIIGLLFSPVFWLGIAIGLIVGWNLLPQPAWVKRRYDAVRAWFRSLSAPDLNPFD